MHRACIGEIHYNWLKAVKFYWNDQFSMSQESKTPNFAKITERYS